MLLRIDLFIFGQFLNLYLGVDYLIGSDDVACAGYEGHICILLLIVLLQLVLEKVKLQGQEHLNIILPAVSVFTDVNETVDLIDEGKKNGSRAGLTFVEDLLS